MKRLAYFFFALILLSSWMLAARASAATINYNNIISDSAFDASSSMSATQIDAFLNTFPNSCISSHNGFSAPNPTGYSPSSNFTYGSNVSAGLVIAHAAQAYGISPKVLLVTLQKEQGLVVGDGGNVVRSPSTPKDCGALAISASMGYNCPDSQHLTSYSGFTLYAYNGINRTSVHNTCVEHASYVGFSRQVIIASWQLTFDRHRSEGLNNWYVNQPNWDNSDDLDFCYSGRTVKGGPYYLCPDQASHAGDPYVSHSGQSIIDGTVVTIINGATAALYNYTPHLHGNLSFFNIFTGWFGNPNTPCFGTTNVAATPSGTQIFTNKYGSVGAQNLSVSLLNNTGTACAEVHTLKYSYTSWLNHIPTGMTASDPSQGMLVTGNMYGKSNDELMYIKYAGAGGKLEVHTFKDGYQQWASHVGTNLSGMTPSQGEIITGDMNGDGKDELLYVLYNGASGKVEVHTFAAGYKSWASHSATNLPALNPANGEIITGDMNGDGKDELLYVLYNGASGKVEVHTFAAGYKSWASHAATALDGITDPTHSKLITGDMNGDGKDELLYVLYNGASGKVEVHTFAAGYKSWTGHTATAEPSF
ncbi:MAG: FG-GAP repeat domain-containing protein [Candidatus Saccharimonadales bacterium]